MHNLRGFIRLLLIAVVVATPLWAQSNTAVETVPGEVLIKLNPNFVATASARDNVFAQIRQLANVDHERSIGGMGAMRFHSANMNVQAMIDVLSRLPFVDVVQPNYVYHTMAVPNDPSFGQLWGLRNTGQTVGGTAGTAGADIEAVPAWDITTGTTSVVVSIIDTGIDYNHPDLVANVWSAPSAFSVTIGGSTINCAAGTHGYNAITATCNPLDDNNHGSHVAGTIGATGNNGVGVVGVNWTTKIIAAKFLDSSGSGNTADAVDALEFLIQVKQIFGAAANIRVCSNSWGGGGFDQVMLDEINKANTAGILFVAAAGNAGTNNDTTPNYPSNYNAPNVVAVAATDNRDAKASFSNYGRTTVHLGAPGVNILSTTRNNTYSTFSGTSMATPHVSGAAALILAACPALNTAQLKSTILNNVEPISSMATTTITGGRLNVYRAIQACGGANPDFSVSASPTSRTITAGNSTTYTVTVSATGGFTGTVNLGVSGLPSGASASFSPASITTSGTSTLTVTTTTGTPAGTSSLTITATSGSTSHTAGVTLVVQPAATPDFTVAASPSSRSITPGASTTFTVTVGATGGFTGTVNLGVSGLPSGATGTFSPTSITTSGTSTLSVTTTTGTPVGTSNLTITGTSGSTSHTASVSLVISTTPPAGKTVGYTTVFGSISTVANRRAQPVTMTEAGTLTAVTMWHRGGSGNVIFGIYSGASVPTTRIAVTASTPQSATDGWQTIPLTAPVQVAANTRIWLAWVYQSVTGTAYQTGTPGRVDSGATWSGGMPASWGSTATSASNIYSINATYTPAATSPNLALNKPATASSSYNTNTNPPSNAVDGSTSTYWASGAKSTYGTTQWLAVDLGSTNSVSRARISWSSTNYATNYNIQYLNGSTWTNCATITDGGPGLAFREISFPAVTGQQFRVYATAGGPGSYYTIYEFELYNQ